MSLEALHFRDATIQRIALGTWGISGDWKNGITIDQSKHLVKTAVEQGVNLIDTAAVYGSGKMETALGELGLPKGMLFCTKIPAKEKPPDGEPKNMDAYYDPTHIRNFIEQSLVRLRRESLDIVLLHNWHPSWSKDADFFLKPLFKEREKGNVRFVGISLPNGYSHSILALIEAGVDVIQAPFNSMETWAREGVFPYSQQVLVMARSLLLQGILSQRPGEKLKSLLPADYRFQKYHDQEHDLDEGYAISTVNQLLLETANKFPNIVLVVGMTTEKQISENTSLLKRDE